MASNVLVIDLDPNAAETLRAIIEREGRMARVVYDPSELGSIDLEPDYAIVFADPGFPKINGMDLLDYLRVKAPDIKIVAITGRPDKSMEDSLWRMGITHTLVKPYSGKEVETRIKTALAGLPEEKTDFMGLIGRSAPMQAVYGQIQAVARADSSVLITGETGTGKELVALAIHNLGARKNRRFVTINCGALSESLLESELFGHEKGAFTGAFRVKAGKFEYADGGTLFLDEIGEISAAVQVKLLKAIETGEVERLGSNRVIRTDARLLFATNRDLTKDVGSGRFRRDLYYRVNVFPIETPPLRKRAEDIPALAVHFARYYSRKHDRKAGSISPGAMNWLMGQKWEGNVRELENRIERAVLVGSGNVIELNDLTKLTGEGRDMTVGSLHGITYRQMGEKVMAVYEKRYLLDLLSDCGANVSLAAKKAGLDRKTLYGKMAKHGIIPSKLRRR